ncbi:MAG: hypothetical protein ACREU3_12175, partial [Steroidobacteraceae bacterium]
MRSVLGRLFAALPASKARRSGFGLGTHLALGLAAVAAVVIAGQILASRTTRIAVNDVRGMQTHDQPLAFRAGVVIEKLAAYDRTVDESLGTGRAAEPQALAAAQAALTAAVKSYFAIAGAGADTASAASQAALEGRVATHVAHGRGLVDHADRRREWQARRR